MNIKISKLIGNTIAKNRKSKKLNQREFAAIIGISNTTLSLYERGERTPDIETLLKISEYFKLSLDELCGSGLGKDSTTQTKFETLADVFSIINKLQDEIGIEMVFKHQYTVSERYGDADIPIDKEKYSSSYSIGERYDIDFPPLSQVGIIFDFNKLSNAPELSETLFSHISELIQLNAAMKNSEIKEKMIEIYTNDTSEKLKNVFFKTAKAESNDEVSTNHDKLTTEKTQDDLPF